MKTTVWAGALALVILAGGGFYYFKQQQPSPGKPDSAAAAGAAKGGGARPAGGGGGPVSVSTVKAVQRDQIVAFEATGTVSSLNTVDVKPQISSVITQVHVKEGQSVKRGDPLFTLDNRSDTVNLTKAQAQLARDRAALADAQRQFDRSRDLLARNFVSQSAVDSGQTLVETQQAVVAASKAAVDAAQLSLGYNRISAPTAGRVGGINVFAGSYVQPSGNPLLTITQLDPIAVSFSLPQRNLADALQGLRNGKLPVTAALPDTGGAKAAGKLDGHLQFIDSVVDPASGTVRVKAVFDNPNQQLWPGAYVTVSMALQTLKGAIVVPQTAIITGPRGRSVFVVDADKKAASRPIELVYSAGPDAVVTGVEAGATVIVDGRENVRPGSVVVERSASKRSAGSGAAGGGAGAGQPGRSGGPAGSASGATP